MYALNDRQMHAHVPVVALLLILSNGLTILAFLFIVALTVIPLMLMPLRISLVSALAFPALMIAMSIPGLIAGFGLRARKGWARWLGMAGAAMEAAGLAYGYSLGNAGLPAVVLGVLLGIYAIFVLAQVAAAKYLAEPSRRFESSERLS